MTKEEIILKKLKELNKSSFRSSFKLNKKDILYINQKGLNVIVNHAYDFVNTRLNTFPIKNDGRQTPMKGHPVFVACHATGCCCRKCLYKWHGIKEGKVLTTNEINYIVSIIMAFIILEMKDK